LGLIIEHRSPPPNGLSRSGLGAQIWGRFPWALGMTEILKREEGARFIGTIERLAEGWRASFRLRVPNEVFTQQGDTEVFVTELQATKWVHVQATARGISSIEIRRQT